MSKRELTLFTTSVLLLVACTYLLFFKPAKTVNVLLKETVTKDSIVYRDSISFKTIYKEVPANIFFTDTVKVYQPNYVASYDTSFEGFTASISFRTHDKTFLTRFVIPEKVKEVYHNTTSYEKITEIKYHDNLLMLNTGYSNLDFSENYYSVGLEYNRWFGSVKFDVEGSALYDYKHKTVKPFINLKLSMEL